MAGMPRGFLRGLLVGGAAAVAWGMLSDRQRRVALLGGAVDLFEGVPYLGAKATAALARRLMGVYRAIAEEVVVEARSGELMEMSESAGYLPVELGQRARDLQVTAMGPTPYLVQITESRVYSAGLGRQVKVAFGDVHDIPYPEGFFDHFLSVGVLHRWERPEMALAEIHRVLKPGGKAWIYDLRRDVPEEGWELVLDKLEGTERLLFEVAVLDPWRRAYTEGQIAALVARSPFGQASVGVLPAEFAGALVPGVTRVVLQKESQ